MAAVCPLCGSTSTTAWRPASLGRPLRGDDLAITDHRYGTTLELVACTCGFRFAPESAHIDLVALYAGLDDPGYEESADARRLQQRALLAAVRRAVPDARSLLDVGAASGLLVEEAERAGLVATGVEPSERLASTARERGLHVVTGTLADLPDGEAYDIVTLVDVIEHVSDPVGLLRDAAGRMSGGGCVLVVTPDLASVAARVLRDRWWHLRLAHVGYFTRATLSRALALAGLVPETWWRPGWTFEIGYLGERVGEYVPPARWVTRKAAGWAVLGWTIPLNVRDSWAVIARRRLPY
jgi:2-polyprenyl-3-methyl-5-hydroxy-6-metoxy-1,4-benzoquinol methylase